MSFKEAAEFFRLKALEVAAAMPAMAAAGAHIIETEAKAELGTYQSAAGPFPAWDPLSLYTKEEREKLGYPTDNPLLMTDQLRDSIKTELMGNIAAVGTDLPYASDLENGIPPKLPPRPFIGRASYVKADEVLEVQAKILNTVLRR